MEPILLKLKDNKPMTRLRYVHLLQKMLAEGFTYKDIAKLFGMKFGALYKACQSLGFTNIGIVHKLYSEAHARELRKHYGFYVQK